MNILVLDRITKNYGNQDLLHAVSLGISDGDKIGIIGVNGAGKTTLLRIIAGITPPDSGRVTRRGGTRIAFLPQTPVFAENTTILEAVMEGAKAPGEDWQDDSAARSILMRLGCSDVSRRLRELSGGEKKRVALARTLLEPAELLILDEPTNHLDADMVAWLEDYLASYRGVLVMVTHDRYFLDRVTNKIVEIDQGSLYSYETNYAGYLAKRQERIDLSLAADVKRANLLRTELAWLSRGARARSTKQKAHIQRIEALQSVASTVLGGTVEMDSVSSRMGRKTIEIRHVSKSYEGRTLFRDFSYIVLRGERIGIIGRNGCGKTTLIRVITGLQQPDSGSVTLGETIRIGYFAQENEDMEDDTRVIDYIRNVAEVVRTSQGTVTASQMLERFLFPPALQQTPVSRLSGGEKRRLYLLRILMGAPNVLILDEPTNDLDITTLETLEDYLDHFDGIVIAVSHDRYFLDRTVNRIFAFEGEQITQYEGGYTDYVLSSRRAERRDAKEPNAASSAGNTAGKPGRRGHEQKLRFTYREQQEYEHIEADLAALETRIADLDAEIEASATQYDRLNELMADRETAEAALDEKTERWVYLSDLAERIEAQGKANG